MRILISACLLGACCRYDGKSKQFAAALTLRREHELVPVCPEQLGGLPTPRPPCERVGERVISAEGVDRTDEYDRGAQEAARLYDLLACDCAVLKARSPMCGRDRIYDGTFFGTLMAGDGRLAALLRGRGVKVYTEDEIEIALLNKLGE